MNDDLGARIKDAIAARVDRPDVAGLDPALLLRRARRARTGRTTVAAAVSVTAIVATVAGAAGLFDRSAESRGGIPAKTATIAPTVRTIRPLVPPGVLAQCGGADGTDPLPPLGRPMPALFPTGAMWRCEFIRRGESAAGQGWVRVISRQTGDGAPLLNAMDASLAADRPVCPAPGGAGSEVVSRVVVPISTSGEVLVPRTPGRDCQVFDQATIDVARFQARLIEAVPGFRP